MTSVFGRIKPGRKPGWRGPLRAGHNKGPIGPLDSEPPWPWTRDDVFDVAETTRMLREMGADIGDRDIEHAVAEGLQHNIKGYVRTIRLGDAIDWSQRYIRKGLTRKEATEFTSTSKMRFYKHKFPYVLCACSYSSDVAIESNQWVSGYIGYMATAATSRNGII